MGKQVFRGWSIRNSPSMIPNGVLLDKELSVGARLFYSLVVCMADSYWEDDGSDDPPSYSLLSEKPSYYADLMSETEQAIRGYFQEIVDRDLFGIFIKSDGKKAFALKDAEMVYDHEDPVLDNVIEDDDFEDMENDLPELPDVFEIWAAGCSNLETDEEPDDEEPVA